MVDALTAEPVMHSFTKQELQSRALEWMRIEYGLPSKDDHEARARWHERLGMLVIFIEHLTSSWCSSGTRGAE